MMPAYSFSISGKRSVTPQIKIWPLISISDVVYRSDIRRNVILAIENVDLYLGNEPAFPNLAPLFSEFLPLRASV